MLENICEIFLGGAKLTYENGNDSKSIVVQNSYALPTGNLFAETLNDIKRKHQ